MIPTCTNPKPYSAHPKSSLENHAPKETRKPQKSVSYFNRYERFPALAETESPFWQGWALLRLTTFRLIENKYFETAVIIMILLSSLALVRTTIDSFVCFFQNIFSQITAIASHSRREMNASGRGSAGERPLTPSSGSG